MFENKRIEMLEKRCAALQADNKALNERNKELQTEINNLRGIVAAADGYAEEHRKAMRLVSVSRARYELAYKQLMKLKKEYEQRMEKVLKGFE